MRPILFESGTTDFSTNGLGRPDVISCEVTEERNGEYELEMVISIEDPHYSDIRNDRILYSRHDETSDCQPFQIYRITRPIDGKVTVYAEHISYRMSLIPVMPFTATTVVDALSGLSANAAESNPFTFWTDKSTEAKFTVPDPTSMRSLLGGSEGSILDAYGGEWEFDGFTAKLHNHRGRDNGVTLQYGKNITDLMQEENIQNTYTGILPFWKGGGDGESSYVFLPERVLHADSAANFPYSRTKVVDFSSRWQESPSEEQLRNAGISYMKSNNIGIPSVSVEVSFAALWQTDEYNDVAPLERVRLCDTVTVIFSKLGVRTKAKVIKTTYDCLRERYTEIEIGEAKTNLEDSIAGNLSDEIESVTAGLPTKSYLEGSVARATKLITGGLGGYVYLKPDANGKPEELLILGDDPDYTKAQEVWRWNKNGLGYSSTGYEGTYSTAITADGHIVADFVDSGTMTANILRTGLIQDLQKKNFWNLDTGELQISAATTIDGKMIASTDDIKDAQAISETYADNAAATAVANQTQRSIFNKLTNNGTTQGIYLYGGRLYLNADYMDTGTLLASYIKLGGKMDVYRSLYSTTQGGYFGYMTGSTGAGQTTTGLGLRSLDENREIIVTSAGVRMTAGTSNLLITDNNRVSADGGFVVTNGTKSRAFDTEDYGSRLLYSYETPSPMFGDIGEGTIGEDGEVRIQLDPVFAETINTDQYQVFLQAYGEGKCYVSERLSSYFIVRGEPGLSFGWEVKAKQADFDQQRFESFTESAPESDRTDYGTKAADYLTELNEGRISA